MPATVPSSCSRTEFADQPTAEAIIPDVHLASSISLDTESSVVQTTDEGNPIRVFQMRWNGRDTKVDPTQAFDLGNRTVGTRIATLPFANESDVTELAVFSQARGDDIVQSSRPLAEAWESGASETSSNVLLS